MQRGQFEALVDDWRLARFVETAHAGVMRIPEGRRHDRLGQAAADDLSARPAEGRLSLRVPRDDPAVRIDPDEGIVRRVDDQPCARFALGQTRERVTALLFHERHDDQVADRHGEVLLVDRPGAWAADMLGAQDPDGGVVVLERHVEHRADTVRDQVAGGKPGRSRIVLCVVRLHDPFAFDSGEVGWRVEPVQNAPGVVAVGARAIEPVAPDRRTLVCESPQAQPLHPQRASRQRQDAPQPRVEALTRAGIACREIRQRIALRCQAPFARPERRFRRQLFADVVEHGDRRGHAVPVDHADRSQHPQRLAFGSPDVQPDVVRPAVAPHSLDQFEPLRRIDVVAADWLADDVRGRHADQLGRAEIDGEHAIVVEAADHRRERAQIKKLRIGMVRHGS